MANRRRGEVAAIVDGRPVKLCLTLGALCELEAAFAVDDLARLADRFAEARLSARDVARIFAAGLTGGGTPATLEDVFAMHVEGGLLGIVAVVSDLLALTFGGEAGEGRPASAAIGGDAAASPPPVPGADEPPSPGTR
jgi:hypothetical protein